MKKIIQRLLPAMWVFLLATNTQAQDNDKFFDSKPSYRTAIGLRGGETSGLTIKHFSKSSGNAVEGIVGMWPGSFSLTALYEHYTPIATPGLAWYAGLGGHIAFRSTVTLDYTDVYGFRRYYYRYDNTALGIDGIIGIEYKIPPIPMAISLDMKPFVEVNQDGNVYLLLDPGIGVKVTF